MSDYRFLCVVGIREVELANEDANPSCLAMMNANPVCMASVREIICCSLMRKGGYMCLLGLKSRRGPRSAVPLSRSKGVSSKPPAQCSLPVSCQPIGGDQARVGNSSMAIHREI
jgi:hypothetical protein